MEESTVSPAPDGEGTTADLERGPAPNAHGRRREISRGMVRLFKEYVGRGPTDAQTFINDDVVLVLLRDTLTRAEKTLAESDRAALVREVRRGFQGAMREEAIEIVQEQTGHRVVAFLSDNAVYPDFAAEIFILGRPLAEGEDPSEAYEVPPGLE